MSNFHSCTVSLLTPAGRGAIATISVSGARAAALVDGFFRARSGLSISGAPAGRILFGAWQRAAHQEDVVVSKLSAQRMEVHCHGGRAAAEAIMNDLLSGGAVEVDWREWTRLQAATLLEAEAAWALAAAATERCAAILLDQHAGALQGSLEDISSRVQSRDWKAAEQLMARLLQRAKLGQHLCSPFRVALIGRPNVGKSTLINQLLGYRRAIVYDQPGTTRDIVSAITAFDGWPVELFDTAGIRDTDDALERAGTMRARNLARDVDAIILVHDPATLGEQEPHDLPSSAAVHHVLNKYDQYRAAGAHSIPAQWSKTTAVAGQGIAELAQRVIEILVPQPPDVGEPIPFTVRQRTLLAALQDLIQQRSAPAASQCLDELIGYQPDVSTALS